MSLFKQLDFASPAPGGKSGTGGGFGVVSSGKGLVSLRLLDLDRIGVEFCGGSVGKKKMCTLPPGTCATALHQVKRLTVEDFTEVASGGNSNKRFVFIETQETKPEKSSVFIAPSVSERSVGDFERYANERRTVPQWEEYLLGCKGSNRDEPTEEEREEYFSYVSRREDTSAAAKTPFKKRKATEDESPMSPYVDVEVLLKPISMDLGGGDASDSVKKLKTEWPKLVENVDGLREVVVDSLREAKKQKEAIEEEFKDANFALSGLSNLVGRKPSNMDAGTVFDALDSLKARMDVNKLSPEHLAALMQLKNFFAGVDNTKSLTELFHGFSGDMNSFYKPIWDLLDTFSVGNRDGRKLQVIQSLLDSPWPSRDFGGAIDVKAWMHRVEGHLATSAGVPSMASVGAGVSSMPAVGGLNIGSLFQGRAESVSAGGNGQGVAAPPPQVSWAEFNALKQELSDLKAQSQSEAVTVEGFTFKSISDAIAWMGIHSPAENSHLSFLDASGMMAMTEPDTSLMDHAKLHSMVDKAGFASREDILLNGSYTLPLPVFFGKDTGGAKFTQSNKVLPAIADFDVWNGVGGSGGAREALRRRISDDMPALSDLAKIYLVDPAARAIAAAMMTESRAFLTEMSTWMTEYYQGLSQKGHDAKAAWELVCRAIRAIFKELAKARMGGRGHKTTGGVRGPAQLWANLQGLRLQREYLDQGFASHKSVINILHSYLLDTSVTQTAFDRGLASLKQELSARIGARNRGAANG